LIMQLLAVGRLRDGPEASLFARYSGRLRPRLSLVEIQEARGSAAEIRRREGAALLTAMTAESFVVALDPGGDAPDSEEFAKLLERWLGLGRSLSFVIGGAEGLDQPVLARANYVLSLGPPTWPHLLIRVMLAEQLYRAQSIASGHPYHRGGRP
jgi:23S rRNA (pseudouridine1915-N3)-methyltransferase